MNSAFIFAANLFKSADSSAGLTFPLKISGSAARYSNRVRRSIIAISISLERFRNSFATSRPAKPQPTISTFMVISSVAHLV